MFPQVVVAVAAGVAVELTIRAGQWVVTRAWEVGSRKPLVNYKRPAILYDERTRRIYRLQPNGNYKAEDGPVMF